MDEIEKQELIESLPPYLKDLALEVQDRDDEYEKVKLQLASLKEASEKIEIKAKNVIEELDEDLAKIKKIETFIVNNPEEAEARFSDLDPILKSLINRVSENKNVLNNLKVENEIILQDILIFSEDERKLKQELEHLNQTLKINLDFALQNAN